MAEPSGDHTGSPAPSGRSVRVRASPPSAGSTRIWAAPSPRFDTKVMERRVARLRAGASVLVSRSVSFAWRGAAASAAAGGGPTYMSTEAWYLEPPPCVSLIDCSPASAASAYPKDTLHVSDTAGQE